MPRIQEAPTNAEAGGNLSPVVIALMKGVVYQESDPGTWQALLNLQARVREYIAVLGLDLVLDEAEGYAYLRQRPAAAEGETELPRLVPRRQLSYPVSLLLALLRKKLAEFDATSGETRLILSRAEIAELMRLFLPDTANEARLMDRIDSHVGRVAEMGFLRPLRGREDHFEVRRILKAFVDAQWLSEFDCRLAEYRDHPFGRLAEEEEIRERP
jgi:hypothetical protein